MKLILAAIVLALLWRSRRKSGRRAGRLPTWRPVREDDDGILPVDPYLGGFGGTSTTIGPPRCATCGGWHWPGPCYRTVSAVDSYTWTLA